MSPNRDANKKIILVIEDEQSIRAMIRLALESADYIVKEAEDTKQAQRLIADQLPDLILLDWMLPAMSGVEFTKRLKQEKLTMSIPIIMLTAKAEEENKVIGLEAGADDYVIKPFSPRELIARIRAVLRRGPLEQPDSTIRVGDLIIDTAGQRVSIQDKSIKLGPLEYRLLVFFVSHQNRVYTRDELLTHVWGGDAYLDERTVDVLIRRLRKQLHQSGYDRCVQTVHGSGYRFSAGPNE
jgi:two-component system phosphate regulon response regulator PhoB